MTESSRVQAPDGAAVLLASAERACRAIPPLFPLASSVAVNPFLGQSGEPFSVAAARLRRVAGASIAIPRACFAELVRAGEVIDADLVGAWSACSAAGKPTDVSALKAAIASPSPPPVGIPTVAELASRATGQDWSALVADRIGHWAASYFDEGQALWCPASDRRAWSAWRATASRDLTPEIMGLRGFARTVADLPDQATAALAQATARLGLEAAALDTYFHQLLSSLGGYAQYARYRRWQAELTGATDDTLRDLLSVRLVWEAALLQRYGDMIAVDWRHAATMHAEAVSATPQDIVDEILQEAAERAGQRRLAGALGSGAPVCKSPRPRLQAAFCIDVRSEVLRRALESLDPDISTLGFAGFFGLAIAHRPLASDTVEPRFPVLLSPALPTCAGGPATARRDHQQRIVARASRAWGRFKVAAVSSFAFVEAAGLLHVGRLLRDALGLPLSRPPAEPPPRFDPQLDPEARAAMAEAILRAMSLTEGFAPLVLLVGHGARVVNNPHASALHCGACGGYSGEVNARLLAGLLNDDEVRARLASRGLNLPSDTLFVAGLHDTTTDTVTLYEQDRKSPAHDAAMAQARAWLQAARTRACGERALRLPGARAGRDISRRAHDWAQVRPEWGLAGCQTFIAAPRRRSAALDLQGRAFLHDYDWRRDDGFKVLELILTAPVVVASWISLQYFGSSRAPALFGGGNKLLHNVTGGMGVVEGNGGLLRGGLPWQSIHDGEKGAHDPLRLSVYIEAPRDAIAAVLGRHPGVRDLFDNRWLHLFALDDSGRAAWRYAGGLRWCGFDPALAVGEASGQPLKPY